MFQEGMEFVLMERFCQDPAEEFFDKQRQFGRRSDRADIIQFGYNSNTVRIESQFLVKVGTLEVGRTGTEHGYN